MESSTKIPAGQFKGGVMMIIHAIKSKLAEFLPDRVYLQLIWHRNLGGWIDFRHPKTFNEKIQWLKLYDRNPEYSKMVDKYNVKRWVAERIGEEYIIPTYGVWDSFDEIEFDKLPNSFVIKCTHDSGSVALVKDKNNCNWDGIRRKIQSCLRTNYYKKGREWPYKNVRPRIIIEEMITQRNEELNGYQYSNFEKESKVIQVNYNSFSDHKRSFYAADWEIIETYINYQNRKRDVFDKSITLSRMLDISKYLSENMHLIKKVFYNIEDKLYFGEITIYPEGGLSLFESLGFEKNLGPWLKLPSGGIDSQ